MRNLFLLLTIFILGIVSLNACNTVKKTYQQVCISQVEPKIALLGYEIEQKCDCEPGLFTPLTNKLCLKSEGYMTQALDSEEVAESIIGPAICAIAINAGVEIAGNMLSKPAKCKISMSECLPGDLLKTALNKHLCSKL